MSSHYRQVWLSITDTHDFCFIITHSQPNLASFFTQIGFCILKVSLCDDGMDCLKYYWLDGLVHLLHICSK
jgi:hypothetical protein